jgi:hypothetical protein
MTLHPGILHSRNLRHWDIPHNDGREALGEHAYSAFGNGAGVRSSQRRSPSVVVAGTATLSRDGLRSEPVAMLALGILLYPVVLTAGILVWGGAVLLIEAWHSRSPPVDLAERVAPFQPTIADEAEAWLKRQ